MGHAAIWSLTQLACAVSGPPGPLRLTFVTRLKIAGELVHQLTEVRGNPLIGARNLFQGEAQVREINLEHGGSL